MAVGGGGHYLIYFFQKRFGQIYFQPLEDTPLKRALTSWPQRFGISTESYDDLLFACFRIKLAGKIRKPITKMKLTSPY